MVDVKNINPSRLRFARKRRGITIKKLSEMLGLTTRSLSAYENGQTCPKNLSLSLLSEALKFPKDFFFMDDIEPLTVNSVSFRSFARMSATVRDSALHASHIAIEFTHWIDKKFDTPNVSLHNCNTYEPEAAAEVLRNEWSLGERPISNMVHLLESKGIKVFSLIENTNDMDAYSFWMDGTPFVFLNTKKSVERGRFDAAHELGHLVLHAHGEARGKEIEAEANRFASAFLMPWKSIVAQTVNYPVLESIIVLKSYWLVSAAAMVRRLRDVKLLTEWQYRSLTIELSKRGFLRDEPKPIKRRETSKLLPMLFNSLSDEAITKHDVAKELGYYAQDIDAFMFNLTITELPGGHLKTTVAKAGSGTTNHLRLVK